MNLDEKLRAITVRERIKGNFKIELEKGDVEKAEKICIANNNFVLFILNESAKRKGYKKKYIVEEKNSSPRVFVLLTYSNSGIEVDRI